MASRVVVGDSYRNGSVRSSKRQSCHDGGIIQTGGGRTSVIRTSAWRSTERDSQLLAADTKRPLHGVFLSYSTHSLQIVPDTWFTHRSIWGEPGCLGKSVNHVSGTICKPCDRLTPILNGGQGHHHISAVYCGFIDLFLHIRRDNTPVRTPVIKEFVRRPNLISLAQCAHYNRILLSLC